MATKTVCPVCGSSDLRVQKFIRLDLAYEDAQYGVDKDIINKKSTELLDDDELLTLLYCNECGNQISRQTVISNRFKNEELLETIGKRMGELETFRENSIEADFQLELAANDIDNPNKIDDMMEFKRRRKIKEDQQNRGNN